MTRRTPLGLVGALLLAAVACGPRGAAPPPNVLLLVLDTARADAFSSLGGRTDATPVFDGVAREGVLFTRARSTSAWTLPSHGSLFTGLYPSRHGAHHESHRLAPEHVTLAEALAATHDAAGFSENPHIGIAKGFAQGFALFEETWRTRRSRGEVPPTVERVLAWLGSRDAGSGSGDGNGRPFLLFVNLMDPHLPYVPPESVARPFLPASLDGPTVERLRSVSEREARRFMTGELRLTDADLTGLRALYDAEVSFADARAGRILDALRNRGELDRTVVAIVADHGENVGEHGLMEHQLCLYETLLRVPLAIRFPRLVPAGQRRDDPVQLVDLMPTLLAAVGVPLEAWPRMEGRNLLRRNVATDRPVYAEYMRPLRQRARFEAASPGFDFDRFDRRLRSIQVGNVKLIASDRGELELYDLAGDPRERVNLAAERPEIVARLQQELARWVRAGDTAPLQSEPALDPETVQALRELGYVE